MQNIYKKICTNKTFQKIIASIVVDFWKVVYWVMTVHNGESAAIKEYLVKINNVHKLYD